MRGASAAEARPERDAGGPVSATFKAPLLTRIFDNLDPERRQVVLDFGAGCHALISKLTAERGCRIEIADFIDRNIDSPLGLLTPNLARLAVAGGFRTGPAAA